MRTIYLAGPISGLTWNEATEWRNTITPVLKELGYNVLNPLTGKDFLEDKGVIQPNIQQHESVLAKYPVIYNMDMFRVRQSDILLVNFRGCKIVSIGTVSEINLAHEKDKLVILIMDKDNIHNHPFITERSIVVETMGEAITILKNI